MLKYDAFHFIGAIRHQAESMTRSALTEGVSFNFKMKLRIRKEKAESINLLIEVVKMNVVLE